MTQYLDIPFQRLDGDVLRALLEDFASRSGTDYGARECSLAEKVADLGGQLERGELRIVFEAASEQWDLLPARDAAALLGD